MGREVGSSVGTEVVATETVIVKLSAPNSKKFARCRMDLPACLQKPKTTVTEISSTKLKNEFHGYRNLVARGSRTLKNGPSPLDTNPEFKTPGLLPFGLFFEAQSEYLGFL